MTVRNSELHFLQIAPYEETEETRLIMKFPTILGAAVLFIASTAMAYDMTYMSSLNPRETKSVAINLPAGKSMTEVWGTNGETISCTFIDPGTGNAAYQAKNVQRCVGRADLSLPSNLTVKITNSDMKSFEFRIWVHDVQ